MMLIDIVQIIPKVSPQYLTYFKSNKLLHLLRNERRTKIFLSRYLKFEMDEIRLKIQNEKKNNKRKCPDNLSKNMHTKFQTDRGMGTLSKIGGTESLEERRRIPCPIWANFS